MNMLQVLLFVDVATTHSIHQTAENYTISPQGASKALMSLERELNMHLLNRSNKETLLTEDGLALLDNFTSISLNYRKIKQYCDATTYSNLLKNSLTGEIHIAISPRFYETFTANILNKLYFFQPQIKIYVKSLEKKLILNSFCSKKNTTYDFAILVLMNYEISNEKFDVFLKTYGLLFQPFFTTNLYTCGLKNIISKFGDYLPAKHNSYSTLSYEYTSLFEDFSQECNFQINSIGSQLSLINSGQAVGAYTMEEYKKFFDPVKHSYIPFSPPLICTYGILRKKDISSTLIDFVSDFFREKFYEQID